MKKAISVQRVLMLTVNLTGDKERDFIALKNYDFEGLQPMEAQVRDMIEMSHEPKIFLSNEKGVFSHALGEDNVLSIWKENIAVEDIEAVIEDVEVEQKSNKTNKLPFSVARQRKLLIERAAKLARDRRAADEYELTENELRDVESITGSWVAGFVEAALLHYTDKLEKLISIHSIR